MTIFVLSVFWIYSETPVIKASGRELSSLLLLGTLVSFLMTFAVVAEPSTETCAITRFGIGICYTLCYAALVTKTNRIHRIFNTTTQCPHKPRYTTPLRQTMIDLRRPELLLSVLFFQVYQSEVSTDNNRNIDLL